MRHTRHWGWYLLFASQACLELAIKDQDPILLYTCKLKKQHMNPELSVWKPDPKPSEVNGRVSIDFNYLVQELSKYY